MSKGATVKIRNFMEWLYFSIKRKNKYINNMEFDAIENMFSTFND